MKAAKRKGQQTCLGHPQRNRMAKLLGWLRGPAGRPTRRLRIAKRSDGCQTICAENKRESQDVRAGGLCPIHPAKFLARSRPQRGEVVLESGATLLGLEIENQQRGEGCGTSHECVSCVAGTGSPGSTVHAFQFPLVTGAVTGPMEGVLGPVGES